MSSSPVIALKDVFGNTSHPRHFLEFQTRALPLQILSGAIEEGFNVRMLVGEPGVGKTALLLRLVQQLQSTALTTRLFLTHLRGSEFLHYFLQELGVARPSPNFAEAQKQLTSVLERNFSHGRQVMVVIDEAHGDSPLEGGLQSCCIGDQQRSIGKADYRCARGIAEPIDYTD